METLPKLRELRNAKELPELKRQVEKIVEETQRAIARPRKGGRRQRQMTPIMASAPRVTSPPVARESAGLTTTARTPLNTGAKPRVWTRRTLDDHCRGQYHHLGPVEFQAKRVEFAAAIAGDEFPDHGGGLTKSQYTSGRVAELIGTN